MKLDLKIGDIVYDQVLFPGKQGKVVNIDKYLLVIKFGDDEYYFPYKDDGNDETNHFPRSLSKTPYNLVGFNTIYS